MAGAARRGRVRRRSGPCRVLPAALGELPVPTIRPCRYARRRRPAPRPLAQGQRAGPPDTGAGAGGARAGIAVGGRYLLTREAEAQDGRGWRACWHARRAAGPARARRDARPHAAARAGRRRVHAAGARLRIAARQAGRSLLRVARHARRGQPDGEAGEEPPASTWLYSACSFFGLRVLFRSVVREGQSSRGRRRRDES